MKARTNLIYGLLLAMHFFVIVTSCGQLYEPSDKPTIHNDGEKKYVKIGDVKYYKDKYTNLCFAEITTTTYGGSGVKCATCVPCDSLVKLGIK